MRALYVGIAVILGAFCGFCLASVLFEKVYPIRQIREERRADMSAARTEQRLMWCIGGMVVAGVGFGAMIPLAAWASKYGPKIWGVFFPAFMKVRVIVYPAVMLLGAVTGFYLTANVFYQSHVPQPGKVDRWTDSVSKKVVRQSSADVNQEGILWAFAGTIGGALCSGLVLLLLFRGYDIQRARDMNTVFAAVKELLKKLESTLAREADAHWIWNIRDALGALEAAGKEFETRRRALLEVRRLVLELECSAPRFSDFTIEREDPIAQKEENYLFQLNRRGLARDLESSLRF